MGEKITISEALDRRDLLRKKLFQKIEAAHLIDCKKSNEENTFLYRKTPEAFSEEAKKHMAVHLGSDPLLWSGWKRRLSSLIQKL